MAGETGRPDARASPAPDRSLRAFSGYGMKRAFHVIQADLAATLAPFGLRMVSFSTLTVIADTPGLRQSQIADALLIERPNLVQLLDELQRMGLIERTPHPSDRRAHAMVATEEGLVHCW